MENTYPDAENYVSADCGHEWPMASALDADDSAEAVIKDSNGNVLADGDAVVPDQGPEGQGLVDHAQDGHKGQEHPAGRRRP